MAFDLIQNRRRPFHLIVSLVPLLPFESGSTKQLFSPHYVRMCLQQVQTYFEYVALSLDDLVGTQSRRIAEGKGKYTMPESSISRELRDSWRVRQG